MAKRGVGRCGPLVYSLGAGSIVRVKALCRGFVGAGSNARGLCAQSEGTPGFTRLRRSRCVSFRLQRRQWYFSRHIYTHRVHSRARTEKEREFRRDRERDARSPSPVPRSKGPAPSHTLERTCPVDTLTLGASLESERAGEKGRRAHSRRVSR